MNKLILLLWVAISFTACTSIEPYSLDNIGEDGLALVKNHSLDELAIRPNRPFSQYKKILIEPLSVSYSKQRRNDSLHRDPEAFQLDKKELEIFNRRFVKAFRSQWENTLGWELSDQAGNDVIIVRATISDFYLYASIKNDNILPTDSFVNESSRMVLNLELIDSISGEVLLRCKDKKTTGWSNSDISTMRRMSSVQYWSDAYMAFRQWATSLSTYLS
ncbi:DUF3313 family protein [bacterium AH-315-K03]|nr:DUF3313 family protein [bacterium AH-315-K03]